MYARRMRVAYSLIWHMISLHEKETMMTTLSTTRPANDSLFRRVLDQHPLLAFFTLAYAGSWIVWLPMLLAGNKVLLPASAVSPGLKFLLTVLAPFTGPTLAAFVITAALEGKAGVRALLGRYVQWRFGWPWYLVALDGPPVVLMASAAMQYGAAALPPLMANEQRLVRQSPLPAQPAAARGLTRPG
jgi:hypothetical protein